MYLTHLFFGSSAPQNVISLKNVQKGYLHLSLSSELTLSFDHLNLLHIKVYGSSCSFSWFEIGMFKYIRTPIRAPDELQFFSTVFSSFLNIQIGKPIMRKKISTMPHKKTS